ncbi:glycine-rich domain-containing protein [Solibacillus silvestris]
MAEKMYLAEKGLQVQIKQGVDNIALQIKSKEAGKVMKSKVFETPGTFSWTVPVGVTEVYLTGCGGGGSGASATNTTAGGGSGGGAHYVEYYPLTVVPGQTYTITVGKGGLAPTELVKNGFSGGITSFGNLLSLPGGGAGITAGPGGAAGGPFGVAGASQAYNDNSARQGKGGDCGPYQGGVAGSINSYLPGGDGGPGAGGGGAGANNPRPGKGGDGFLFIKWWE